MKPVINLDELELKSHEHGNFHGKYGSISDKIGAKKLGHPVPLSNFDVDANNGRWHAAQT